MEPADTPGLLMTVNVTFNVPLLTVVIGVVVALLVYAGILRFRRRLLEQRADAVARLITGYLRNHGQEVTARCFPVLGGRRFIAVVESPPVKRFRYSHIVESSLIQHLLQTAGVEVDKVYWRFPLAWEDTSGACDDDPYFAQGQALLEKSIGNYKVEEATWESYEKATHNPDTNETP